MGNPLTHWLERRQAAASARSAQQDQLRRKGKARGGGAFPESPKGVGVPKEWGDWLPTPCFSLCLPKVSGWPRGSFEDTPSPTGSGPLCGPPPPHPPPQRSLLPPQTGSSSQGLRQSPLQHPVPPPRGWTPCLSLSLGLPLLTEAPPLSPPLLLVAPPARQAWVWRGGAGQAAVSR